MFVRTERDISDVYITASGVERQGPGLVIHQGIEGELVACLCGARAGVRIRRGFAAYRTIQDVEAAIRVGDGDGNRGGGGHRRSGVQGNLGHGMGEFGLDFLASIPRHLRLVGDAGPLRRFGKGDGGQVVGVIIVRAPVCPEQEGIVLVGVQHDVGKGVGPVGFGHPLHGAFRPSGRLLFFLKDLDQATAQRVVFS